jgi:hypothetical protein
MVGDPSKGYEIARYPGEFEPGSGRGKFFNIYPYLTLLFIPLYPVMVWMHPDIPDYFKIYAYIIGLAIVVPMGLFGFLVVENALKARASPKNVYSNGIESSAGRLERWRKRPDFVPKAIIDQVEMNEHSVQQVKGYRTFITMKIKTKEGWEKFFTARHLERMQGFQETVSSRLGVPVIYKRLTDERGKRIKASALQSVPQVDNDIQYCTGCGARIVTGAGFCGVCGRRLR